MMSVVSMTKTKGEGWMDYCVLGIVVLSFQPRHFDGGRRAAKGESNDMVPQDRVV